MNQPKAKSFQLSDPVASLPRVGPYILARLERLGVKTLRDLLEWLPFRVDDFRQVTPISQLRFGEKTVISGQLDKLHSRTSKKGALIIEAKITDATGRISALWFNQRYLLWQLKEGQTISLFGQRKPASPLGNPFFVSKIVPATEVFSVYPSTAGLGQATWRRLMLAAQSALEEMPDLLPSQQFNLPKRANALSDAHFHPLAKKIEEAWQLLGQEELVGLILAAKETKKQREKFQAFPIALDETFLRQLVKELPFQINDHQRRAAWEIIQDMRLKVPMTRLLYGEVGSGKTAVGLLAAGQMARSGRAVVWLNPTTALAAQQYRFISRAFTPFGIKVSLCTGASKPDLKADVFVGTHAILHRHQALPPIGLIIIDEQQRFGVSQRQTIFAQCPNSHLLMMSATPIPRSLAQTVYGFLNLTVLHGRLAHQQRVETKIFTQESRSEVEAEIALRLSRGEPGFVVCPFIDEGYLSKDLLQTGERKAIMAEQRRLKKVFPRARLGLMHGRLKEQIKTELLEQFRQGKIDILLSTSVVETGIDNPLASWILIESADRFGLSQLHQLRGRVGRGERQSVCFLGNDSLEKISLQRLQVLCQLDEGMAIAQRDLELRGPGELTGLSQSGLNVLRYASFSNQSLVAQASAIAAAVDSAGLKHYPTLKEKVKHWLKDGLALL